MKGVCGKHRRGEENISFRCSAHKPRRTASTTKAPAITDKHLEEFSSLKSDVKKTTMAKWGVGWGSIPFLGVLGLKSVQRPSPNNPGSWPPPPAPLCAASEGRPAKCREQHPDLDRPMAPPEAPARGPRRLPGSGARWRGRPRRGRGRGCVRCSPERWGGRERPGLRADVDTHHTMP